MAPSSLANNGASRAGWLPVCFPALSVNCSRSWSRAQNGCSPCCWRDEAAKAGKDVTRIALAFEAGRDGVWLAHVIHPSSVAVSREHRRAKTDRLDTELLKRGSWGGCVGNGAIAAWCAYRRLPKRTPSGRTGNASAWSQADASVPDYSAAMRGASSGVAK